MTTTGQKSLLILGTRGVPAAHGGFETFAHQFSLYLVERGWRVTVYCQDVGDPKTEIWTDQWCGIDRVHITTGDGGPAATMQFDWRCIRHAIGQQGVPLVLGYNTALFTAALRVMGRPVLMNMDGIEWRRAKWGRFAKAWFYLNEWAGALLSSHLIADHPAIADHLARKRNRASIAMIPYGADNLSAVPEGPVRDMGLHSGNYLLSIGRIEPENLILELVTAYAREDRRSPLVCLGKLDPDNAYHRKVIEAAQNRVIFPGAIYDPQRVQALRYHARAYCHGHTVGGTNPSLVEALGASNAVIAHDNIFNRWVAGPDQTYFSDPISCADAISRALHDDDWLAQARAGARRRFMQAFTWQQVLEEYEELCTRYL